MVLLCLPGCYTVLKHPQQADLTGDNGERRSCSECHESSYLSHDPFMYRYYDGSAYWNRWYGYYYDPWWYDDYWYYDSWDGEGPPLMTGERTRWGEGPARPVPPERGATTGVSGSASPSQPKPEAPGASGSGSSAGAEPKDTRTRWGGEPARPTPPAQGKAEKKPEEQKPTEKKPEEKKQSDDKDGKQ
jgi:hypothetical protein